MRRITAASAVLLGTLVAGPGNAQTNDHAAILERINLPDGFSISIFAEIPNARGIEVVKSNSMVFVGSRHRNIFSMIDGNGDGVADEVRQRGASLNVPNSLASQDSTLYIGLQDKIVQWSIPAEGDTDLPLAPLLPILEGIDSGYHHGWRTIAFGPDRKLYIALGAPCNLCELTDITGKILRMNPDGSNVELVADGVRNSVGFDWHPVTGDLWFTDNGADSMGDDIPPDELNRVRHLGEHFGFPYVGGNGIKHPGFEEAEVPAKMTGPEVEMQPHSANLGVEFYEGSMFPATYKNDAFIAQHGSWDRTEPVGYRIMRVMFDDAGNPSGKEVFADGWLDDDENTYGRPVDIEELPDGSLLVSDDFAGVVYRISYDD
jgi:glucose/arabinose dehydrogenase